jgi:hypothetical protein
MTQIFATKVKFLGLEYVIMVADRKVTHNFPMQVALVPSSDRFDNEIIKINSLGCINYAFSGTISGGEFDDLSEYLESGNIEESRQIVFGHFQKLAQSNNQSYNLVIIGSEADESIAESYIVSGDEILMVQENKKIKFTSEIPIGDKYDLLTLETDEFRNIDEWKFIRDVYEPTIDLIVDRFRKLISNDESPRTISNNVDIVIRGPTGEGLSEGVDNLNFYNLFPEYWINGEQGDEKFEFYDAATHFFGEFKNRVLSAESIEE